MKGFAQGPALIKGHKTIGKWPVCWSPHSLRVFQSSVVECSNRDLESHRFDSHWGLGIFSEKDLLDTCLSVY